MDIGALTGITGSTTSSDSSRATIGDTFDTFLTLLTTQLQNQDPIDPLNTDEFTNQLVQFSQVEQQISSNDKLDSLLQQTGFNQISFAASLTGKLAEFSGSELSFDGATPLVFGYDMPAGVTSGTVNIRDSRGTVVYSANASSSTGRHSFTWAGETLAGPLAAPGTYRMEVVANDAGGAEVSVDTSVARRVSGVDLSGNSILVETADGPFDLNDIIAIREPQSGA